MSQPPLYDFAGEKRHETEKAILVFDGDKEAALCSKRTKGEESLVYQALVSKARKGFGWKLKTG